MQIGLSLSLTGRGGGGSRPAGVYVSSVEYDGIPVGDDTVGDGSAQNPYLTIDKGYASATSGQTIWLNGDPASPTDYRAATFLNISKPVFVDAVVPLGASISSTTTTARVVHFTALANGVSAGLGRVIVDGQNLCPACVTVNQTTTRPSLRLVGTKLVNWTSNSMAQSSATAQTFDLIIRGLTAAGGAAAGGILFSALGASSINIDGADIDIATAIGSGISLASSGGALVSATIRNATVNLQLDPTLTGTTRHLGIGVQNMPNAVIEDCEVNILGTPGARTVALFRVLSTTDANQRDSSGAALRRLTGHAEAHGGIGVQIGQDGVTTAAGLVRNAVVEDCEITGSATAAAGGFHGFLNGDRNNTVFRRIKADYCGLGLVDKDGLDCKVEVAILERCTQSYVRPKGAVNGNYKHITIIQSPGFTGEALLADSDTDTLSGCEFEGNLIVTDGGKAVYVIGNAGIDMVSNVYWPTSAFGASDFIYNGVTYATFAAYQAAVETTAVSVDPSLVDLRPTNTAVRIVAADPDISTDFDGSVFADPAAAGALEVSA